MAKPSFSLSGLAPRTLFQLALAGSALLLLGAGSLPQAEG